MIESTAPMINRDWIREPDSVDTPSFFYPSLVWPHLIITTSLIRNHSNALWLLDRLLFISRHGIETIIYQRPIEGEHDGIDDPEAIAHLAPIFQDEAHWAYGLRTSVS